MFQKNLICRLLTITVLLPHSLATENCLKTGKATSCCADYYVVDGKCAPCPSGTFGPNCDYTCTYPDYGRRCLDGECQCPKEFCDPSEGCKKQPITYKTITLSILQSSISLQNTTSEYNLQKFNGNLTSQMKTEDSTKIKDETSSTTVIAVISVIGVLVIVLLIVVIVFQLKGKITLRLEKRSIKRDSNVASHRHVDTYCEIDDDKVIDHGGNDMEDYEVIDQSRKDAAKYAALPSKQSIAKHGSKTMSSVSMQKIMESKGEVEEIQSRGSKTLSKVSMQELVDDNAEDNIKVEMRNDRSHPNTTPKRFGKTSEQVSGYIDMDKGTKKDYVSMCAENPASYDSKHDENIKE